MSSELFDPNEGFALQSQSLYVPPSQRARELELAAACAGGPTAAPKQPPRFQLSAAELAKIDRNLARLRNFPDTSAPMF